MEITKSSYKFYSDAAHGWLAVKRDELVKLNLVNKISNYSYQRGSTVYVEQHGDMHLFIETKKELGQVVVLTEGKFQNRSPIRSYDHYVG